jgi:hypothetical protein
MNTSLTVSVVENVLVNEDYIYTECARFDHGREACSFPHPSMNYRPKPGPEAKASCAIALFGQHSTNLGYWLLEYLPRLFALKWDDESLSSCLLLYRGAWLGHELGELNVASILTELWRIPRERLWDTGRMGPLRVKQLYVPPAQVCGSVHGPLLAMARHQLMRRNPLFSSGSIWRPSTARRSIVFVDRSAPDVIHQGRSLLNRDELLDMIHQRYHHRDIDVLVYSRSPALSHEWTGRTFANALIVVGVHGAGLANIMFAANDDAALIEIICDWRHYSMYSSAATALGFDYYGVLGTPYIVGQRREEPDVIVNVTSILDAIDQHLLRLQWNALRNEDDIVAAETAMVDDQAASSDTSEDSISTSMSSDSESDVMPIRSRSHQQRSGVATFGMKQPSSVNGLNDMTGGAAAATALPSSRTSKKVKISNNEKQRSRMVRRAGLQPPTPTVIVPPSPTPTSVTATPRTNNNNKMNENAKNDNSDDDNSNDVPTRPWD